MARSENSAAAAPQEASADVATQLPQQSTENAGSAAVEVSEVSLADVLAATPARPDDLIIADPLSHNGTFYTPGARVQESLFTPAQLAGLKKDGVIKFRHEVDPPEVMAADYQQLASDIEVYKARIAELEAAQGGKK